MSDQPNLRITDETLQSIEVFIKIHPSFSEGSLRWMIFRFREKLIADKAICYCGRRVLINPSNFFNFILEGKAKNKH